MKKRAEIVAIVIMAVGILMVWQPWVHLLFRWGFLVTLVGIVAFTVANHLPEKKVPVSPEPDA